MSPYVQYPWNVARTVGCPRLSIMRTAAVCTVLLIHSIAGSSEISETAPGALHEPFGQILQRHVSGVRFDYDSIVMNPEDLNRLSEYIDSLEARNPAKWPPQDALAYWINLYNAATLELVLKHYPVSSIKDIGGVFGSPWKKKVVVVAGIELTLNDIENDIIRPEFKDARIHFALNCASIGCPPLADRAYIGDTLDAQLDLACERALNEDQWVEVTEEVLQLSRIFDWYEADFEEYAGSVREFISQYRKEDRGAILDSHRALKYKKYDWDLNRPIAEMH